MPTKADDSPNIKWHLPAVKEPKKVDNMFSDDIFKRIKDTVTSIPWGPGGEYFYHTSLGRWEANIEFDPDIEEIMLQRAREIYQDDTLVKSFHYTSRYQKQNGNIPHLWKHMDQHACQHSIDMCIEKNNVDWGIEVDGTLFSEAENSAICFYGQQQVHSRPEYPQNTTDDDYLTLLFLHFVKPDHWYNLAMERGGLELVAETFRQYGADADVRYFEATGTYAQPQVPAGQQRCECHSYAEVPDVVQSIIQGNK